MSPFIMLKPTFFMHALRKSAAAQRVCACGFFEGPGMPQMKESGHNRPPQSGEMWFIKSHLALTQPVDFSVRGARRWWLRQRRQMEHNRQRFQEKLHAQMPLDTAAATFLIGVGGRVKFKGQSYWVHNIADHEAVIPVSDRVKQRIEAINLAGSNIMYHAFDNLEGLDTVRWLNLQDCPNVDDWTLSRVATMFRDSLVYLDVSGCPKVTERGLASLHKARKLQTVVMERLPRVAHPELTTIMLAEALPECNVRGYIETEPPELQQLSDRSEEHAQIDANSGSDSADPPIAEIEQQIRNAE